MLDETDWHTNTKQDHYLAQIAAEIRRIAEGFSKSPKSVNIKDLLIPFKAEPKPTPIVQDVPTPVLRVDDDYEVGPDVELQVENPNDPKWERVAANAKSVWAARFGVADLEVFRKES